MRINKEKNLKKIVLFFSFALISAFVIYTAFKESYRSSNIEREIEELKKEAGKVKVENLELKEKISYLETDEFKERVAKERLNLQKKDEQVVIIKQGPSLAEKKEEKVEEETTEEIEDRPNYVKWLEKFLP